MTGPQSPARFPVAVVGAGVMGRGIAQWAAQAGYPVLLHDADPQAAAEAVTFITAMLHRAAAKGTLSPQRAEAAMAAVSVAASLEDLRLAGVVIEAIAERLDAKRALFTALEAVVGDACILATNTSSLSVTAVAAGCQRPERVAGFHFFNPVPLMKVVEVVAGERTDPMVTDRLCALAEACGHRPVRCQDTPGFLVNHAGRGLYTEGLRIVQDGIAGPEAVDTVLREAAGFRMGPFELFDLTGIDVSFPVLEQIYAQFYHEPRFRPSPLLARRVAAGLYGRKVGEGFYRYAERQPEPPPAPPPPGDRPLWISDARPDLAAAVRAALADGGLALDHGPRPAPRSLCLVTPLGEDATTAALAQGLDPERTVAVDGWFLSPRRACLMLTAVTAPDSRDAAHAAFAAAGRAVTMINDSPGFIAQRVVSMIVAIACEIAQQRIATPADIDAAVALGLGYPAGPLTLGDTLGAERIVDCLRALSAATGDPRYRPSPWLTRRVALGLSLTTPEAAR